MIDLTEPIRAVQSQTDDFTQRTRLIAEWYGVPFPADDDEFPECFPDECITTRVCTSGRCEGKVHVVQTFKGWWLVGSSCASNTSGSYHTPSLWNRTGYEGQEEAFQAGLAEVVKFFTARMNSRDSVTSDSERMASARCLEQIKALGRPKQLTLEL